VVWLRIGNCSVEESAQLLREKYIRIRYFHESLDAAVLTLP
jgi:predicted nuclease of predicted toxin-antitoxin system